MKKLHLLFCMALCCLTSLAQTDRPFKNFDIQSPNAAALEKFGTVPVSNHTGIPQIGVPIYQISEGSLTLPISLSYHAGGLKVMETASWVGLGWSLTGGYGAISRTVMGACDEDQDFTAATPQLYGHYSNYGYNNYVRNTHDPSNRDPNYAMFSEVATGEADGEPDIYHFNFNGHSGKFYFDDDRNAVFEPVSDYKVEVFRNSVDGFYKFIIITPDGTRYHFGQGENESGAVESAIRHEKVYPFREETGATFHAAVSSWLLTKIESADRRDVIRLHYVPEKYGYHTLVMGPNLNSGSIGRVKNSFEGWRLEKITFSNGYVEFIPGPLREDLCAYNLWTATDDPNLEAKRLASIIVRDANAVCYKKFDFSYSYFNNQINPVYYEGNYTVDSDRKRLKLTEIRETGCGTDPKPPYVFSYYDENLVPRRLSYAQDHWGYYNGQTANASMHYSGRESAYPAIRAGTLSLIQYPTGGSTSIEFGANKVFRQYTKEEPSATMYTSHQTAGVNPINKTVNFPAGDYYVVFTSSSAYSGSATLGGNGFSRQITNSTSSEIMTLSGSNTLYAYASDSYTSGSIKFYPMVVNTYARDFEVGGLRVEKIINSTSATPGNSDDVVITYDYNHNGISSGVLYGRPVYLSLIRNDFEKEYGRREVNGTLNPNNHPYGCVWSDPQVHVLQSMTSIFPLDHSQGYHIGYKYVTVSQNGGQSQYQYDVADIITAPDNRPIAQTEISGFNCSLDIRNYPPAPLPYVPKRGGLVAEYHFSGATLKKEIRYEDNYTTPAGEVPGLIHTVVPGINKPLSTIYKLKTARLDSRKITTKTYNDNINDYVVEVQEVFFAGSNHHQVSSEHRSSNTETYKTLYKYPLDYTTGCEIGSTSVNSYNSALSSCATTYPYNSSSFSSSSWYLTRLDYDACVSTARSNYAHNREGDRAGFESCLDSDYSTGSSEYKAVVKLLSANSHAPVEVSTWKGVFFLGSSFNAFKDYGTDRDDGQVYPDRVFLFQTGVPMASASLTPSYVSGSNLVRDSDYAGTADVTYQFNNGRLSEFISSAGTPIAYRWGYNNAFPIAKVVNAKANEIFHENFEGAEGNSSLDDCKTGRKSRIGGYSQILTGLTNGTYRLEYWRKVSGTWQYEAASVNVSAGSSTISLTGELDEQWDDVRFYPINAQMTTYSYNPLEGRASATDANGVTIYYEYDQMGRLHWVEDFDGNILTEYKYHYQSE